MLEQEFEERLELLEKKVEELTTELSEVKNGRAEEPMLIPGAEYDFVPTVKDKVLFRGVGHIVRIEKASHELGLSAREWEMFSVDEENHE
jgi:hypothetical protein